MYYVYMVRCNDNTIYTGITTNLERRFNEHKNKTEKCAKYTYLHGAKKLECAWECENRSIASKIEYMVKRLTKVKKEELIIKKIELPDICEVFCEKCKRVDILSA